MTNAAQFWDDIAEKYSNKPVDDLPAYHRKLEETRTRLRPEHVVLDIGCGTGSLALELAPDVSHVHGVDISSEMVKIAQRKAEAQGVSNTTFYSEPFDQITEFEPESFDVICAYNILHLLPDLDAALASIATLLKPGGSFVSSTACLKESWVPFFLILPVMRLLGKAPPVNLFAIADLEAAMQRAGFRDLTRPDVGCSRDHAFVLATKPAAS